MRKFQPLVLQKLDIRIPGIHVSQLALHRHLPETTDVEPHAHKFTQCLLYLSGRGVQEINGRKSSVETGTAVFIPPGVRHAFHREANRRPMCLVLDFEWRGAKSRTAQVAPLPMAALHDLRQQLARVAHQQRQSPDGPPLQISAMILGLLNSLLAGMHLLKPSPPEFRSAAARKLDQLLVLPSVTAIPLAKIAHQAGYQHDYLNRMLKQHDGLTLGQMRARKLVARAQEMLLKAHSIADVASAVGFNDPNYFARWFRKHTGVSPSNWRRRT